MIKAFIITGMEPRQFRPGNLIEYQKKIRKIVLISINNLCLLEGKRNNELIDITDGKPIPLSEQILIKAGFKKLGDSYVIGELNELYKRELVLFCDSSGIFYHDDHLHPVEYVHKLQNLYYELNDKELDYRRIFREWREE